MNSRRRIHPSRTNSQGIRVDRAGRTRCPICEFLERSPGPILVSMRVAFRNKLQRFMTHKLSIYIDRYIPLCCTSILMAAGMGFYSGRMVPDVLGCTTAHCQPQHYARQPRLSVRDHGDRGLHPLAGTGLPP